MGWAFGNLGLPGGSTAKNVQSSERIAGDELRDWKFRNLSVREFDVYAGSVNLKFITTETEDGGSVLITYDLGVPQQHTWTYSGRGRMNIALEGEQVFIDDQLVFDRLVRTTSQDATAPPPPAYNEIFPDDAVSDAEISRVLGTGTRHGVNCNVCGADIFGSLFLCLDCPGYALCSGCEQAGGHDYHIMYRLRSPAQRAALPQRVRDTLPTGTATAAETTMTLTGAAGGVVWGTDVYTSDSNHASAAVHAGVLAVGETKQVTVYSRPGLQRYVGSVRHGIMSRSYGAWGASYAFSEKATEPEPAAVDTASPQQMTVTGTTEGVVWGTDVYTSDSNIGAAAVHAGIIQPGETRDVTVFQRPGLAGYLGTTRNGVASRQYGAWGASFAFSATVEAPPVPAAGTTPLRTAGVTSGESTMTLTGTTDGSCWGTNVYTDDSRISTAAVHAGILQPGETRTVTVYHRPGLAMYVASSQNGVTSGSWGTWRGSFAFSPDAAPPNAPPAAAAAAANTASIGSTQTMLTGLAGGGNVWGCDIYTSDSNVAMAAVHAGVLRPGETRMVTVYQLPGQPQYPAVSRNGITSGSWGAWGASFAFTPNGSPYDGGTAAVGSSSASASASASTTRVPFKQTLTGSISGSVWGSIVYCGGSDYATSAVHAGVLAVGETKELTIYPKPGLSSYVATVRNGVTSRSWAGWHESFAFAPDAEPAGADAKSDPVPPRVQVLTGSTSGAVWGTDWYCGGSDYATAAVHAGVLGLGETKEVAIYPRPGLSRYAPSTRNGVVTSSWGSWDESFSFTADSTPPGGARISTGNEDEDEDGAWSDSMGDDVCDGTGAEEGWHDDCDDDDVPSVPTTMHVTGNAGGDCWGTGIYCGGSDYGTAAAHAGVVRVGETKPVTVYPRPGLQSYVASVQNGVQSMAYGPWHKSFSFTKDAQSGETSAIAAGGPQTMMVTGTTTGSVWGTDVYCGGSDISSCAVHAGVVKPGETKQVQVYQRGPAPAFFACTRNGVQSSWYGAWQTSFSFTPDAINPASADSCVLTLTGTTNGIVWGDGVYCAGSNANCAATHCGLLRVGETQDVVVYRQPGRANYPASTRNGVTTSTWGNWHESFSFTPNGSAIDSASAFLAVLTGSVDGTVFGDEVYACTSDMATAAVHAGVLRPGERKPVMVHLCIPLGMYGACARNGVTSRTCDGVELSFTFSAATAAATNKMTLTGTTTGQVWGTAPAFYGGSDFATAAVHAGVLAVEETKELTIRIASAITRYTGSASHGVVSHDRANWHWAFTFEEPAMGGGGDAAALVDDASAIATLTSAMASASIMGGRTETVTGSVDGTCWGTDFYTSDSDVGTSAVHAGLVLPGETKTVTIYEHGARDSFAGTTRNGVTSNSYGSWGSSFTFTPAGTPLPARVSGVPTTPNTRTQTGGISAPTTPVTATASATTSATATPSRQVTVTGSTGGRVWGTGTFTSDSDLASAAVHAGVVTPGETKTVTVYDVPGLKSYSASASHGVTSNSYGPWSASFTFTPPGRKTSVGGFASPPPALPLPRVPGRKVTLTGSNTGAVWGTGTYTSDSDQGSAAVHAGVLAVGETKEVVIVDGPGLVEFVGSTRNGVTSNSYGQWGASFSFRPS